MKKQLGVLGILIAVCLVAGIAKPSFYGAYNLGNIADLASLFTILSIGMAFVIITGGIDLSLGSVVGLVACLLPYLLKFHEVELPNGTIQNKGMGFSPVLAIPMVLFVSLLIGWVHGILITKARLQPFIVTLCGLLIYRSLARSLKGDSTMGLGEGHNDLRWLATGNWLGVPNPLYLMLFIAVIAAIFLNLTVFGRHLQALGRNEQAARYSGINTDRMTIAAYMICSFLAGVGGILYSLDLNSVQPSNAGNGRELYAIAGAVLGGCSLRGGEGSILGVMIGATLMCVISNAMSVMGLPDTWEMGIIGSVILVGVITDEVVHRLAARRRLMAASAAKAA